MASTGHSRQRMVSDLKDTPPSASAHQMNRPHNYAESSYFIHQRYEDTALIIFQQQQAKKKKEPKGDQFTPLAFAPNVQPAFADGRGLVAPTSPGRVQPPPANSNPSKLGPANPAWKSSGTPSRDRAAERTNVGNLTPTSQNHHNAAAAASPSPNSDFAFPAPGSRGNHRAARSPDRRRSESPVDPWVRSEAHSDAARQIPVSGANGDDSLISDDTSEPDVRTRTRPENETIVQRSRRKDVHNGQAVPKAGGVRVVNRRVGEAKGGHQSPTGGGVSGSQSEVEFGRYGSSGVVTRRRVAMTKSDSGRTESRVCTLM